MELTYEFDNHSFEYDVDPGEWLDSLDNNTLSEMAEQTYDDLSEGEQAEIITELLNEGDIQLLKKVDTVHSGNSNKTYVPNWDYLVQHNRKWVIDTVLYDIVDIYEDNIKDYFYDQAQEAYEDTESYSNDKYGYYGVSERDFY